MAYADRTLRRDDQGDDVVELQMRLAGFRGTVPDGSFGPGTELQIGTFQRDVMQIAGPTGVADAATFAAVDKFGQDHAPDFGKLACPCGTCRGYGRGQFRGEYAPGHPGVEAYHRYEYPGIHRMLLWALAAATFYCRRETFIAVVTSGYRCAVRNRQQGRTSTNHHGKAVDFDIAGIFDKREDMQTCNKVRGLLVETANAQIGWAANNRKALEPADIAPTWVHYDVRCYGAQYLDDKYFVTDQAGMLAAP